MHEYIDNKLFNGKTSTIPELNYSDYYFAWSVSYPAGKQEIMFMNQHEKEFSEMDTYDLMEEDGKLFEEALQLPTVNTLIKRIMSDRTINNMFTDIEVVEISFHKN